MIKKTMLIDGIGVPRLIYGTAWKEEATQHLTELALQQGFRGIDTANQRRHYNEAAVGRAVSQSFQNGRFSRQDLFLQTKFTFIGGQDDRLPYDPNAPVARQVEQSFASSLQNLGVNFIDSYLLHGPSTRDGLGPADWEAWRAMETIYDSGRVGMLGASNMSLAQLKLLVKEARIAPKMVQNRCYASRVWDRHIRDFCATVGIAYQGFSLLTANRQVLAHPDLVAIAKRHCRSVNEIVFRFAIEVGMVPLTGTTNAEHMRVDLDIFNFELDRTEVTRIEVLMIA